MTGQRTAFPSEQRLGTGIPHLDDILGGGFPRNSINVLMGHPGTGKTVLAQQLVFHNAREGRPLLYLTTLSEPLPKVITYLQGFDYYDPQRLLDRVVYEDLGAEIAEFGPSAVVDRVRAAIREIGPAVIIIDSFKAIHDLIDSPAVARRLVSELAGIVSAYDTTTFLVGEYDERAIPELPEFAVADAIVELARRSTAKRDERFLRVLKLRGSAYAEGFHAFAISRAGIDVYPRLVSPVRPDALPDAERFASGITGLDALLDHGLWRGSTALVSGATGAGKTMLSLGFLTAGVQADEPGLFLHFQEHPVQVRRTIARAGLDVEDLRRRGLHFQYVSPVELRIDTLLATLFETIAREGIRRVAIDSLTDLQRAAGDAQRLHDYLYALGQRFGTSGVTAFMTAETSPRDAPGSSPTAGVLFPSMVDVLFELGIAPTDPTRRLIRIRKARGIAHDLRPHEFHLDARGARVGPPWEDA
ncbi:MAG: ATPase domain-containing protein [Gemmatimonadota bacterium]|nr:AAA family ATPase [Gemmatimonadota bacterium]